MLCNWLLVCSPVKWEQWCLPYLLRVYQSSNFTTKCTIHVSPHFILITQPSKRWTGQDIMIPFIHMNFQGLEGLLWVAQPINIKLEKENHVAWILVGFYLLIYLLIFLPHQITNVPQKLIVNLVLLIGWLKKMWCKSFQRYPKCSHLSHFVSPLPPWQMPQSLFIMHTYYTLSLPSPLFFILASALPTSFSPPSFILQKAARMFFWKWKSDLVLTPWLWALLSFLITLWIKS